MIKGREGKSSGGYSADFMVCFPSRTHLSLPSKSISSPSHFLSRRQNAPHHRHSFSTLSGSGGVWKNSGREITEEPTSPEVTCAGQIKVRPRKHGGGGKSESKFLGVKKDVLGFFICFRDLDSWCFGAFPPVDVVSDEEKNEDEKQKAFSGLCEQEKAFSHKETVVPPPNALLLMRCRSAPGKSWLELEKEKKVEREEGYIQCENTEKEGGEEEKETVIKKKDLRSLMEEEKNVNMVVMNYDTNYYKHFADMSKETWVVSGTQDPLFRSQSWKR